MDEFTPADFRRPPLKPLQEYLEGLELLEKLEVLRFQLEERQGSFEFEGGEGRARFEQALGLLIQKRERLEHWMALCEQRLDEALQNEANQADAGERLFQSVSYRMAQFRAELQGGEPRAHSLSEDEHRIWKLLQWDFERLREAWRDRLPPGTLDSDP